ncbi:MAG: cell envelope integrity protein CreD [Gloeobacteraceae cyanobacterium ES-bin-316]|nr:cell envelope integrity protein CreD [Ferruginibacter sp.]
MNIRYTSAGISIRIWLLTATVFALGMGCYFLIDEEQFSPGLTLLSFVVSLLGSVPALVAMLIVIPFLNAARVHWRIKLYRLLFILFTITLPYAIAGAVMKVFSYTFGFGSRGPGFVISAFSISALLLACSTIALLIVLRPVYSYFNNNKIFEDSYMTIFFQIFSYTTKSKTMDTSQQYAPASPQTNRILIKGLITGGLILLMLIPTIFIYNLVEEREARQKEVVIEVSSKWATAQTLSAPFLVVPYIDTFMNDEGKTVATKTKLILLANELNVNGKIIPEERPRSIYKVLLYKSDISMAGDFKIIWPADINLSNIDYANAKLCFGLSDFKGIEENIYVNFNGQKLLMTPGLPVDDFGAVGLSVPVSLNAQAAITGIPFSMQVKIKGSEQLHFIPMSASSKFHMKSSWASPSFDGDMLPNERSVTDSGFTARWNFNQANLPFARVMKEKAVQVKKVAFGVSLVQPADQYGKTLRSVKYAILFIGLTFAFFFIIELMQKKPFHPVQYALVGLALVIFYTLLLSISEYILFDYAYLVASLATILLISMYAQGHFQSWKTAGIFFVLLSSLYGFIFILIRLEDTALLVGSIGLFLVLALVMYASRKINWYGQGPILPAQAME